MTKYEKVNLREQGKNKLYITFVFLFMEVIIYIVFLYLDITSENLSISNVMKYISIMICFLFVVLPLGRGKRQDFKLLSACGSINILLLRLALLLTLVSDYFLLFTNYYIYGLLTFIIVQILYLMRIDRWKAYVNLANQEITNGYGKLSICKSLARNILITVIVLVVIMIVLIYKRPHLTLTIGDHLSVIERIKLTLEFELKTITLIVLGTFYFVTLSLNLLGAINIARTTKLIQIKVFSIGLLLFVLCDINVGLFNVIKFLLVNNNIMPMNYKTILDLSSVGIWFFYLPSQIMISLSKFSYGQIQQ